MQNNSLSLCAVIISWGTTDYPCSGQEAHTGLLQWPFLHIQQLQNVIKFATFARF